MAPRWYEFFAGAGMARIGFGPAWRCLFANEIDAGKCAVYRRNWCGGDELKAADVATLTPADLPAAADLVWASFPCQDLSLAGRGAGLDGQRSGAFWPFWRLMQGLGREARAPALIVLENVCGALSSHNGEDFVALCDAFAAAGYHCGALVIDAALFVPQSRPRLFIIGLRDDLVAAASTCIGGAATPLWTPPALTAAHARLAAVAPTAAAKWLWWRPPPPPPRRSILAELIETPVSGVRWHDEAATARLLALMSEPHRRKVAAAQECGRPRVGAVYKRTRRDADGVRRQRAEVRFDDIAGCLRTPAGGSSRQLLLFVDGRSIRSRLLSARESARLMGMPDSYLLPANYNQACHLTGDGVVAPVVRYLAQHIFEPVLAAASSPQAAA